MTCWVALSSTCCQCKGDINAQERIKDRLGAEEQQARILLRLERWDDAEEAYR